MLQSYHAKINAKNVKIYPLNSFSARKTSCTAPTKTWHSQFPVNCQQIGFYP